MEVNFFQVVCWLQML